MTPMMITADKGEEFVISGPGHFTPFAAWSSI